MNIINILYHATYKQLLDSISIYGLDNNKKATLNWADSCRGVVYLSPDRDIAESYAESSENVPESFLDDIVVLEIDVNKLDINKLSIDKNVIDNDGSTLEYHGVIPVDAIKNLNSLKPQKKSVRRGLK